MHKLVPVKTELFIKFLLYVGCQEGQGKGGHRKFNRFDLLRPIIVQAKPEVPVFIIKENLKTLGIDREKYLKIISDL